MKNITRATGCIAAALALTGCQSFVSALGFGPKDGPKRAEATQPVFGTEDLEKGRAALRAGYPAAAIKQFRIAALNPETAPDAFNGLGVAYAKLGRGELAERYFRMALDLDATNARYAANLQRFYASPLGNSVRMLAARRKDAEAQLAAAQKAAEEQGLLPQHDAAPQSVRMGAVTLDTPRVRVTRASRREVHLATLGSDDAAQTGTQPVVAVRNPAKVAAEPASAADTPAAAPAEDAPRDKAKRISLTGFGAADADYPVRISLTRPNSSQRPARAARVASRSTGQYPVRIRLNGPQPGE